MDFLLKNNTSQTLRDSSENFLETWETKANLIESVDGIVFANKFFNDFAELNEIERYSSRGAVFAARSKRTSGEDLFSK